MCGWCGAKGTIEHLFIRCPQIQPALDLLYKLLGNLLPADELTFEMYWTLVPHARGRSREAVRLANYLIISCKNVIYHLYRTVKFVNPFIVWVHHLKHRILYEYYYYELCNNNDAFLRKWSVNDTLFVSEAKSIKWLI